MSLHPRSRSALFFRRPAFLVLALAPILGLASALSASRSQENGARVADAKPEKLRASTVIVVRHAEKDPAGDPRDPSLGAVGKKRAQDLAHLLGKSGATRFFANEYKRTQETLAPLSELTGGKVEVVPGARIEDLVKAVQALPAGSVSVVAGHSNTVPQLIEKLGGHVTGLETKGPVPMLGDDRFNRLFVLTIPPPEEAARIEVSTIELRYGD